MFKWAKSNPIKYKPTVNPAPYLHKVLSVKQSARGRLRAGVKGSLWFVPIVAGVNMYNKKNNKNISSIRPCSKE